MHSVFIWGIQRRAAKLRRNYVMGKKQGASRYGQPPGSYVFSFLSAATCLLVPALPAHEQDAETAESGERHQAKPETKLAFVAGFGRRLGIELVDPQDTGAEAYIVVVGDIVAVFIGYVVVITEGTGVITDLGAACVVSEVVSVVSAYKANDGGDAFNVLLLTVVGPGGVLSGDDQRTLIDSQDAFNLADAVVVGIDAVAQSVG